MFPIRISRSAPREEELTLLPSYSSRSVDRFSTRVDPRRIQFRLGSRAPVLLIMFANAVGCSHKLFQLDRFHCIALGPMLEQLPLAGARGSMEFLCYRATPAKAVEEG
ncbi:uncharacterized protein MEPE_05312 [Melanopsichium pennsylvanicum]|uniref:Uncharacterized protein n=1 Tax=Melanopsichium pennsylvanicum TaxID=63383 RepID=A0AAJ4XT34_9BASI|nr:uncharacterized protein MEPE_05312 [Melanopsichium pennsylvanicum]